MSLGTTSRLSGKQLEDDGSSACVLSLAYIGSSRKRLRKVGLESKYILMFCIEIMHITFIIIRRFLDGK